MRAITDRLIWLFSGIFFTHVGHFIYQRFYAENLTDIRLSEFIAMVFENLLQLLVQFLDAVLPVFVDSRQLILGIIVLLILMTILFVWLKIFLRMKNNHKYNAKLKEAETVLAAAQKKAVMKIQKIEALKEKLTDDFTKKETSLQNEVKEKLKAYVVRIKKLEKERLELKEMNGSLMRKLKAG